jgi:hypothetical protein
MKTVFSFSLFGHQDKYCKGLLKNIEVIQRYFPTAETWVYVGNDISDNLILALKTLEKVTIIPTGKDGMINKFYRFFPIDTDTVSVCIVRDADSRIYERDRACIEEFIKSDKLAHIIRDHPNHHHKMMAGMWGIKKGIIHEKIEDLFKTWCHHHPSNDFWNDTDFLCQVIYPKVCFSSIIHDETHRFEPPRFKTPFPLELVSLDFIGQVYEYDVDGNEYAKFPYNT